MTDHAEQPELQLTDYNYFLDSTGDVWRQLPDNSRYEVMRPATWWWASPGGDRVLRPLIIGKPPLPTEPGIYVVNYSKDRPLLNHSIVYLARDGAEWRYYADDSKWTPRGGDTLTRLNVVQERN